MYSGAIYCHGTDHKEIGGREECNFARGKELSIFPYLSHTAADVGLGREREKCEHHITPAPLVQPKVLESQLLPMLR